MNQDITVLLQQLASKLNVSFDVLWKALMREAFINGLTNLFYYAIIVASGIVIYKLKKKLDAKGKKSKNRIYLDNEAELFMSVVMIVWLLVAVSGIFSIGDTINSFFNPEYWVLKDIIRQARL